MFNFSTGVHFWDRPKLSKSSYGSKLVKIALYRPTKSCQNSITQTRLVLPCAVKINGPWRNFIIRIYMGDIKIIFGVKVTYIDVHRPPTSWVGRRKWYRDRAGWWKFRGSEYGVIWVVHPISRYLNFKNRDFLYENDLDANSDKAAHSWGNFLIFHK